MRARAHLARLVSALLTALGATACDVNAAAHDQATIGPPVTIVGTSLGPDAIVPADGVIQIAFDRYLLPSTITRQSFVIVDGQNQPLVGTPLKTVYDPVARTVTIVGPDGPGKPWLTVDQPYKLALTVPKDDSDVGGFRAIDRAPLDAKQTREFVFRAGPPAHEAWIEPSVDFCADVMPLFQTKCSSPDCHGSGARAAAGLDLGSARGVRSTAFGRMAHGANTSGRVGSPKPPGSLFGIDMAIVAPGDPGSSWLTYKLELAPPPVSPAPRPPMLCVSNGVPVTIPPPAPALRPLAPAASLASAAERAILGDFVLGLPMPYPATVPIYAYQPLTFEERERVRLWIARGADVRDCGTCSEVATGTPGAF